MSQQKNKSTNVARTKTTAKSNVNKKAVATTAIVGGMVAKQALKNTSKGAKMVALLMVFVGLVVGVVGAYFITKNDCFELIGGEDVSITLSLAENETGLFGTYTEQGVKIISFGKDVSQEIEIEYDEKFASVENGVYTATQIGTYYIKYHSNSIKYGKVFKVVKVRLITFVEPSEGGE